VPNDFHVELSQTDLDRLTPYDTTMARELADQLQDHADAQGYVFPGPVKIGFESADDLTTGRFRIRSKAQATVSSQSTFTQVRRARAVLEVNGTRHPLQPPGLIVGRGSDATLRINDPGISRQHAEFTVMERGEHDPLIEVHDMGSTNGILVDGRKVPRATLHNGSRVQVGHTTLVVEIVEEGGRV
jgi:FHA domain-containing protein